MEAPLRHTDGTCSRCCTFCYRCSGLQEGAWGAHSQSVRRFRGASRPLKADCGSESSRFKSWRMGYSFRNPPRRSSGSRFAPGRFTSPAPRGSNTRRQIFAAHRSPESSRGRPGFLREGPPSQWTALPRSRWPAGTFESAARWFPPGNGADPATTRHRTRFRMPSVKTSPGWTGKCHPQFLVSPE